MSLNEFIVEDAALDWSCLRASTHRQIGEQSRFARTLTRPLPGGEEKREAIRRLNPAISEETHTEALRKVLRVGTPSLTQTNRAFAFGHLRSGPVHRMLMKPASRWCLVSARVANPF